MGIDCITMGGRNINRLLILKASDTYATTKSRPRFELEPVIVCLCKADMQKLAVGERRTNQPPTLLPCSNNTLYILTILQHNNDMLIHRLFSLFFFQVGMADSDQLIASCVLLYTSTPDNCSHTQHVRETRTNTNTYPDSKQT